jgi:hypothetical protein
LSRRSQRPYAEVEFPLSKNVVRVEKSLEHLIPKFMANRHNDIARLGNALEKRDFAALSALGHELKGTGAGYGFNYVSELGERIEVCAAASDQDGLAVTIFEFENHIKNLRIEFST